MALVSCPDARHIQHIKSGEHLKPSTRALSTSIKLGLQTARPTNTQKKNINTENNKFCFNMEQQNEETYVPKTLRNKANENQVEQRNEANEGKEERSEANEAAEQKNEATESNEKRNEENEANEQRNKANEENEKSVDNSKQKESETPEQDSSKGSLEGSQLQKCSVSFEASHKNGSLDASRERSGSNGSSISSNGSPGSSNKSPCSSNGSSKKVVVVRSAPITIGKIEKKRADSPRSPPVVPPIPEDEEEELLDFVCASSSKKDERVSFIKKLRRSSLTFRESLRRRLSTQSIEDMKVHGRDGRGEKDRRSSTPPLIEWDPVARPTMARRQSTIGVIVDSEFRMGRSMERSSSGDRLGGLGGGLGGRAAKTGIRRGSITEEARSGSWAGQQDPWLQCKFTGWRAPSQPQERTQYWKLPGVP